MKRSLPKKRQLAKKPPRRLFLQQLEKRDLRAADIGFADGLLSVNGTENEDVIEVYAEESQLIVNVAEYDASGQLLDEQLRTFDADAVEQLVVSTGGGDDVIVNDTDKPAVIRAGEGDDVVMAGDGGDVISGGEGDDIVFGGAGRDVILGGAGSLTALLSSDVGEEQIPTEADLELADFEPAESAETFDPLVDELDATGTDPDPLDNAESDPEDLTATVGNEGADVIPSGSSEEIIEEDGDLNDSADEHSGEFDPQHDDVEATQSDGNATELAAENATDLELPPEASPENQFAEPVACEGSEIPDPQQPSEPNADDGAGGELAQEEAADASSDVLPEVNVTEGDIDTSDSEVSDDVVSSEDTSEPTDSSMDPTLSDDEEAVSDADWNASPIPEVAEQEGNRNDAEADESGDDVSVSDQDGLNQTEVGDADEPAIDDTVPNDADAHEPLAPAAEDAVGSDDPASEPEVASGQLESDVETDATSEGGSDGVTSIDPTPAGSDDLDESAAPTEEASSGVSDGEEESPSVATTDDDVIFGGSGNDWLFGGQGDDMIFGDGGIMTDEMLTDILMSRLQDPGDLSA